MATSKTSTVLLVAGVAAIGSLAAYAVYFDHKRRTDASFRRKLRKEKKRVDKSQASSASQSSPSVAENHDLRAALESVKAEEIPSSPDEREKYFMSQVSIGEQLCAQGPAFQLPAAMCFYRAFRVYPSPVELIVIYQKTVPEAVFKIFMEMTNLEVKDRVEGYYNYFPPKSMNVSVENLDTPDGKGTFMRKKILVVAQDVAAGELIYKEEPIVTALDLDLQGTGTHCAHCLREIGDGEVFRGDSNRLNLVYCSRKCEREAKDNYHRLLFTLEPPLPGGLSPEVSGSSLVQDRDSAQKAFVDYLQRTAKASPELVAKFIARQVYFETSKMMPGIKVSAPHLADGGDYGLYDHIERLRFLEVKPDEEEMKLLKEVLQTALPGLEHFVTDERHGVLIGKMSYNSYGVTFNGGRNDKPEPKERPEDAEKTRTPFGTSRQIGSAFYAVSSYISHSCDPSARPAFENGNADLHLIATRDMKKGEEITVAYVDVTQHEGETVLDARRRRRMELARGWRFACPCSRCIEDAPPSTEESVPRDESKVEATVTRVENGDIPKP